MRWIKILAIGFAVIVAVGVISAVLRLAQLLIVVAAIGAAVVVALKARDQLRAHREVKAARRQPTPTPPPQPRQAQRPLPQRQAPEPQDDVEAELARLKREMK